MTAEEPSADDQARPSSRSKGEQVASLSELGPPGQRQSGRLTASSRRPQLAALEAIVRRSTQL